MSRPPAASVPAHLAALLRAVTLAGDVERLARGTTGPRPGQRRDKLQALADTTDARVLDAVRAGATAQAVAEALGVGLHRAQDRVLRARRAAGEYPEPEEVVMLKPIDRPTGTPNVWLDVPRCAAAAPPPWPVSRRCCRDQGHDGEHGYT